MKKFFLILLVLILALAGYVWFTYFSGGKKQPKGPKPVPMAVSKHSDVFNQSVQLVLDAYYSVSEGLVNWDTAIVSQTGTALKTALDSLKIDELKADTTGIYESALDPLANAKTAAASLQTGATLDEKRQAFNSLSENLRLLFIIVKYDREKIYWQECPMAFGDDAAGNWLSKTEAVRNPYLGTKHPKYKDSMLECGGPKDTINFIVPDTTGKK
jgi:Protein of unknown function (DUF3347)